MPSILFDFDSTLITIESLPRMLESRLDSETLNQYRDITEAGIKGAIPFSESLQKRLKIAAPDRSLAEDFGVQAVQYLAPGMKELVGDLSRQNAIFIVSGGIRETLLPVGEALGVPEQNIHGVKLIWSDKGKFLRIAPDCSFAQSKAAGLKELRIAHPAAMVGDAASDYQVYASGLVENFYLFTPYFRCEELIKKGVKEARNVQELRKQLEDDAFLS